MIMRNWRSRQRRPLSCLISPLRIAAFQIYYELRQSSFGFPKENVIGSGHDFRSSGYIWATDYHALSSLFATRNDAPERILLHQHCSYEHDIRPLDVRLFERTQVQIDQPSFPSFGK